MYDPLKMQDGLTNFNEKFILNIYHWYGFRFYIVANIKK